MSKENNGEEPKFFEINKYELDEEWVAQPKLYHRYAKKLADAKKTLEESKAGLELVEADIGMSARLDPATFGIKKVTDKSVENAVILSPEYKEARIKTIQAKHAVDVLDAAVRTLDHRKRALEDLVDLHLNDYFSTPKAKGATREAMDEQTKKSARTKANRVLNKRRHAVEEEE